MEQMFLLGVVLGGALFWLLGLSAGMNWFRKNRNES